MKIEFVIGTALNGGKYQTIKVVANIKNNDSLRRTIINLINNSGSKIFNKPISSDQPLAIYLASQEVDNSVDGYNKYGFGLPYEINEDGTIRMLEGYDSLNADWTLGEIDKLVKDEIITGNPRKIIVDLPIGLGAPPEDLFDWWGFVANTVQNLSPLFAWISNRYIGKYVIYPIKYRKVQKQAKIWASHNGIKYPSQLRKFIDVRASWKLEDVKKWLGINEEYAVKLLSLMGLELVGDSWRLTHSKQSIQRRKRWLANEDRFMKSWRRK